MISIPKSVYIVKLDDIVKKYDNAYQTKIKMKPVDVKPSIYINSSKEINDKDPKVNFGNIVEISRYKNLFPKDYFTNWSEEAFVIRKVKNTVPSIYVISDLRGEKINESKEKKRYKEPLSKIRDLIR